MEILFGIALVPIVMGAVLGSLVAIGMMGFVLYGMVMGTISEIRWQIRKKNLV